MLEITIGNLSVPYLYGFILVLDGRSNRKFKLTRRYIIRLLFLYTLLNVAIFISLALPFLMASASWMHGGSGNTGALLGFFAIVCVCYYFISPWYVAYKIAKFRRENPV
jgi:hypothetical protein